MRVVDMIAEVDSPHDADLDGLEQATCRHMPKALNFH